MLTDSNSKSESNLMDQTFKSLYIHASYTWVLKHETEVDESDRPHSKHAAVLLHVYGKQKSEKMWLTELYRHLSHEKTNTDCYWSTRQSVYHRLSAFIFKTL
jgi:hypothetical protein